MILVDTNVILRFILNDDELLSPQARLIFEHIEGSKNKHYITLLVLSEVIFTLERSYKLSRNEITNNLINLNRLPNLSTEKWGFVQEAFDIYLNQRVSFVDAYQVIFMKYKKIKQIYSLDRDFDKFDGIKRLEE